MRWSNLVSWPRTLPMLCGLCALPVAVAAEDGDQCILRGTTLTEEGQMGHFSDDAPRDIGNGFIVYHRERSEIGLDSTTAQIEHCATGRSIYANLSRLNAEDIYQASADPTQLVREAIASSEVLGLEEVVTLLRSRGIEAETSSSEFESCGCAVFYPELVGGKMPWQR